MKRKWMIIALAALLAAAAAGAGIYYYMTGQNAGSDKPPLPEGMEDRQDIITATGTTATGLVEKEMEFSFLDTDLIVDEVYVSSSDEVEKGAKVLKITDNSLREATRELERAQMDASLAYRQGVIDYETGQLDAESDLKKSQVEATYAQTVYDDAIAAAEVDVQKAQQEVDDAQEIVDEYTAAIEEDYYYTDYEIEEKKAAYEKNVALFFEKLDDYGYELDDDDDDDPDTYNIVKKDGDDDDDPDTYNIVKKDGDHGDDKSTDGESTVLQLLKSEYQENKDEYDQALEDYEAATAKAKAGIAEAQDTLQLKTLALQEAQITLEKTKTSAQADYDSSVIKGEKAQATYQTQLKSLEEALEVLEDAEEEAAENYELFMETIGDGYIYTEKAGTILMVRANENTELAKDGVLLAYSDADTIQVTASVDQSDISQLEIGETAAIVIEDYGTYTGVVTEINPVSQSTSRASVTYQVVLDLDGDIEELSANLTANVYFGITGEEYEKLQSEAQSKTGAPGADGSQGAQTLDGMPSGGAPDGNMGSEGMSDAPSLDSGAAGGENE